MAEVFEFWKKKIKNQARREYDAEMSLGGLEATSLSNDSPRRELAANSQT